MKPTVKHFLMSLLVVILPITCFCAAVTSSLAWYSYSSNIDVAYQGTAISVSDILQVGLKCNSDPEIEDLIYEPENQVAWANPGSGLQPSQIKKYLADNGYADSAIPALTSGIYNENDDLNLYTAPKFGIPLEMKSAQKDEYVQIPLAFRVISQDKVQLSETHIWLNDAEAICKERDDLKNGVRLHINDGTSKFIVSPASPEASYTVLGGLQDLNFDDYYDFDHEGKEIMYGLYYGDLNYVHTTQESNLDDINQTGHDHNSTFCSKHYSDIDAITSYDGITFEKAYYESVSTVRPEVSQTGEILSGKPVCTTNSINGIGTTLVTIWVEGWDHSVYDEASGYAFLLNMVFQVIPK